MIFIGMIYQFDSIQGRGLIMLSDGDKKDFTTSEWVDNVNEPSIGQKVAYDDNGSIVKIKVATETDIANSTKKEEKVEDSSTKLQFSSLDDCLNHYVDIGFKLVKDTMEDESRVLTLRRYADGEPSEVIINHRESNIDVVQTVNGKRVL